MVAFYLLAPFPTVISRRYGDGTGNTNPCREIALFITAVIIVSAFGLPIILARAPEIEPVVCVFKLQRLFIFFVTFLNLLIKLILLCVRVFSCELATQIKWGSAGLVITANIIVFFTIFGFFLAFDNDDVDYSMW